MSLSQGLVQELKNIVLEEYGENLTEEEVSILAEILLDAYTLLLTSCEEVPK